MKWEDEEPGKGGGFGGEEEDDDDDSGESDEGEDDDSDDDLYDLVRLPFLPGDRVEVFTEQAVVVKKDTAGQLFCQM